MTLILTLSTCMGCLSDEKKNSATVNPEEAQRPKGTQLSWTAFETGQNVKTLAVEGHFLWMGLPSGVIRYDTRTQDRHEVFTVGNTRGGLLAKGVYKIKIGPRGNKWIATYGGGLSKFDGKTWTTYTPYGAGPVTFGPEWIKYTPGQGLGDLWVYDLIFGPQGEMWVATWKGVSRFDGKKFKTFSVESGLADKWVYSLAREGDHILWLGTEGGVTRYDGSRWINYSHEDGLGADPSRLGNRSLFKPDARHHATTGKKVGEPNPNYVLAIAVDERNTKWFGTWGAGLSEFDGTTWKTHTREDGLGGNFIHALGIDPDGKLWAATDGGVSWYQNDRWYTLTVRDGLMDNNAFSLAFDGNTTWIGTWKGLNKLVIH